MSGGEIFIVAFVTIAVVSARYWPNLGERVALRLSGGKAGAGSDSRTSQPPRE